MLPPRTVAYAQHTLAPRFFSLDVRHRAREGQRMDEPVPGERMGLSDLRRCAEHGQQFTDDLCDDCRKIARNE